MKKLFPFNFTIIILTIVFLSPLHVYARLNGSVVLEPKNPAPNSTVTLTLVSYDFNVDQSTITWSAGGKELAKGVGRKKIILKTGNVGDLIPIRVSASTLDGGSIVLDVPIIPESVNILYEAEESHVPLFYEGLSLPSEGAVVKFVASPNMSDGGEVLPASSLSYSWYEDDDFIDSSSGIGRQVAYIPLNVFKNSTDIKVVVHSPRGIVAEKVITISPHSVMPILYSYNEILGPNYSSFITKRFESTKDFVVSLEPFYLTTKSDDGAGALYTWLLDGLPVTPLGGRVLALKPKADSYGSKKLSITVKNSKRRLQSGSVYSEIIFDTRK